MRHLDLDPFFYPGGRVGIVLTHGFSGSPPEMRALGGFLAAHGLTVRGVRLPGHGTIPEAMMGVRWQQWAETVEQARAALSRECDHVFLCGLSMGATLSLYVASWQKVAGVISMAAPVIPASRDVRVRLLPVAKRIVRWYRVAESDNDNPPFTAQPLDTAWFYNRLPVSAIHELDRVVRATQVRLPLITAPTLILLGQRDPLVPPANAHYIYDHIHANDKRLIEFNESGHFLTGDVEREKVWQAIYDFTAAHAPLHSPAQGVDRRTLAEAGIDRDVADVLRLAAGETDTLLTSEAVEDAEAVGAAEFSAEQTTGPNSERG